MTRVHVYTIVPKEQLCWYPLRDGRREGGQVSCLMAWICAMAKPGPQQSTCVKRSLKYFKLSWAQHNANNEGSWQKLSLEIENLHMNQQAYRDLYTSCRLIKHTSRCTMWKWQVYWHVKLGLCSYLRSGFLSFESGLSQVGVLGGRNAKLASFLGSWTFIASETWFQLFLYSGAARNLQYEAVLDGQIIAHLFSSIFKKSTTWSGHSSPAAWLFLSDSSANLDLDDYAPHDDQGVEALRHISMVSTRL